MHTPGVCPFCPDVVVSSQTLIFLSFRKEKEWPPLSMIPPLVSAVSQFWFWVRFHLINKNSFNLNFDYQTLMNFKWNMERLRMVISFIKLISFFKWNGQTSTFGCKIHIFFITTLFFQKKKRGHQAFKTSTEVPSVGRIRDRRMGQRMNVSQTPHA